MQNAVSCGGVVFHNGKILALYKNYKDRHTGWVLPKGKMEPGETKEETALREVFEEAGVKATIIDYIGSSNYRFPIPNDVIEKEVHWFLMTTDSYYSKPQREEFFTYSGYYKYIEAYHLLKYGNEKKILENAYSLYRKKRASGEI